MTEFLSHYLRLEPPTWVFLSTFLTIGLFLMFHRFWSLRNLDILLILLFTPGLMLVYEGSSRVANPRSFAQSPINASAPDEILKTAPPETNVPIPPGTPVSLQSYGERELLDIKAASPGADDRDEGRSVGQLDGRDQPGKALIGSGLTQDGFESLVSIETSGTRSEKSVSAEELERGQRRSFFVSQDSGTGLVEAKLDTGSSAELEKRVADRTRLGKRLLFSGYLWLIIASSLLVIRMLLDTAIVRRPMLDPNLSSGGMLFLGVSMLVYLLVNVAVSKPTTLRTDAPSGGPGYILMTTLPDITTVPLNGPDDVGDQGAKAPSKFKLLLARSIAIGANLAIVVSIVAIGYWHFGNFKTGVGAATFYLLLPYTVYMTGRLDHVLPASLLLLAVLLYRQPFAAGLCLGLAAGVVYYPFSLLPLWCSFYWQRGIRRFSGGFITSILALVIAMVALEPQNTIQNLSYMFGVKQIAWTGMDGIWGWWYPVLRLPLILLFILLSISFVAWPAQKSLATLMSCSAALMAATQCWHGFGGGLYLAWFVPLALLTIFRPNLDYCVALEVVRQYRRKGPKAPLPVAATATSDSPASAAN